MATRFLKDLFDESLRINGSAINEVAHSAAEVIRLLKSPFFFQNLESFLTGDSSTKNLGLSSGFFASKFSLLTRFVLRNSYEKTTPTQRRFGAFFALLSPATASS
ncbi:MAG: hypothetical protein ACSHYB_07600 [Roseibacillus sp.]